MPELLQSRDQTRMDEELFLVEEQRTRFLEMECTLDKDSGKIVEMITKYLEHDINLVVKVVAGFERTN